MWLSQHRFCCRGLEHAFEERHERGIFVFAEPPTDPRGPTFLAGHALGDAGAFKCDSPIALTLATWRPIHHCPWCGCKLARRYAKAYTALLDAELSNERALPTDGPGDTADDA